MNLRTAMANRLAAALLPSTLVACAPHRQVAEPDVRPHGAPSVSASGSASALAGKGCGSEMVVVTRAEAGWERPAIDPMPCWLGCEEGNSARDLSEREAVFTRQAVWLGLARIELACCAPFEVRGHVIVTVEPSGQVSEAVVDALDPGDDALRKCVAGQYAKLRVPSFPGGPRRFGRSIPSLPTR